MSAAYYAMKRSQHGLASMFGALLTIIGYTIWIATDATYIKTRYAAIFINASG